MIKTILEKSKSIALFGHYNPDGDCIGAMAGLGRILEKKGKKVGYFVPSSPSQIFGFLPAFEKFKTICKYKSYDTIVLLDLSSYTRLGKFREENPEYFTQQKVIVFDHHPEDCPSNTYSIKDKKATSTCELVLETTKKRRKTSIDKQVATYFYLGLATDSGNFMFDQDSKRTFTNALTLINYGADKTSITKNIFRNTSLNQIKFLQLLLKRLTTYKDIIYSYYDHKELKKYDIDDEQARYGLSIIQNIQGPRLCVLAKRRSKVMRLSLRSKDMGNKTVNCTTIAKQFAGGGHKYAAGGSIGISKTTKKELQIVIKKIQNMIE